MRTLEALWLSLEELTCELYHLCVQEATTVSRLVMKGFLLELESRQTQRQQWDERRADKIYQRRIQEPYRPVARPIFDENDSKRMAKDLSHAIQKLKEVRGKLSRRSDGSSTKVERDVSKNKTLVNPQNGKYDTTDPKKERRKVNERI